MRVAVLLLLLAACGGAAPTSSPDAGKPSTCADYVVPTCATGTASFAMSTSAAHIPDGQPISYTTHPPSSGPHRPQWARWGRYSSLPPERWIHNLEHGGAAFLHHPCAPAATVDALHDLAKKRPADSGGEFRYVMTPYPGLPSVLAVVTWEWTYSASCVRAPEIGAFLDAHYRKAPEDVDLDGSFAEQFLGR